MVQSDTGRVVGCHDTQSSAQSQVRALYANEAGEAMGRTEVLMMLDLAEGQTKLEGVQLMPLGTWSHPRGKIQVDYARAQRFAEGFRKRLAGQDLPILYIHSDAKNLSNPLYGQAAGWISDVRADPDKGVLLDIDFTEEGAAAVRGKKYRYLSAEYFDKVQLPHHDRPHQDVIVGAALVNRPHLKGMNPILNEETGHQFLAEESGTDKGGGPVDPILAQLAKLAGVELPEDAKELTEEQSGAIVKWAEGLDKSAKDATAKHALLEKRLSELEDPDKAKARSLAEAGFEEEAKLLSEYRADRLVRQLSDSLPEGSKLTKVVEEHLREYAANDDQDEFHKAFKLALEGKAVVDLTERGTTQSDDDKDKSPATVGDELVAMATKRAKEDEINFTEAMELVVAENPAKWNEYQLSLDSRQATIEGGEK